MKQMRQNRDHAVARTINSKMAPGSCTFRKSSITSAGWIRSSTTVWRKCSASRHRDDICWTGQKRSCQALPLVRSQVQKRRQAEYELNLNGGEKRPIPRCRAKPEAESKLPFHLFAPHVRNLAALAVYQHGLDAGCSTGTVRLYPSFFRTEKGIGENDHSQSFQWHR